MYVILHEISHVISKASGKNSHGKEFTDNFTKLLLEAYKVGIYNPNQEIPKDYCSS